MSFSLDALENDLAELQSTMASPAMKPITVQELKQFLARLGKLEVAAAAEKAQILELEAERRRMADRLRSLESQLTAAESTISDLQGRLCKLENV